MPSNHSRTLSTIIAIFSIGSFVCGADDTGVILKYKTLSIAPAVAGAHRFEITGTINGASGKGTLMIDGNSCRLNEFGDRTICTEVAYPTIDVTFAQLKLADPAKQDRRTYSVAGPKLPENIRVFLVVGSKSNPNVLRLVVEEKHKPDAHEPGPRSAFPLVPLSEWDQSAE